MPSVVVVLMFWCTGVSIRSDQYAAMHTHMQQVVTHCVFLHLCPWPAAHFSHVDLNPSGGINAVADCSSIGQFAIKLRADINTTCFCFHLLACSYVHTHENTLTQFQDFFQWLAALPGTHRSPDKQVGISKSLCL